MTHPLVASARKYLGTAFRHRGRSSACLDCAGLVVRSAVDLGVTLPDLRHYGREPHRDGLMRAMRAALGEPLPHLEPMEGDVGVFALQPGGEPHHIGLFGTAPYGEGVLTLLHADSLKGEVVEQRLDDAWKARLVALFRWEAV